MGVSERDELVLDLARELMLRHGWDLAVCLTGARPERESRDV